MNTAETMAAMAEAPTRSRAPNGCSRPVMTQYTHDEHQKIAEIADREGRSLSSTVRMLSLRGLEQHEADAVVATQA